MVYVVRARSVSCVVGVQLTLLAHRKSSSVSVESVSQQNSRVMAEITVEISPTNATAVCIYQLLVVHAHIPLILLLFLLLARYVPNVAKRSI